MLQLVDITDDKAIREKLNLFKPCDVFFLVIPSAIEMLGKFVCDFLIQHTPDCLEVCDVFALVQHSCSEERDF